MTDRIPMLDGALRLNSAWVSPSMYEGNSAWYTYGTNKAEARRWAAYGYKTVNFDDAVESARSVAENSSRTHGGEPRTCFVYLYYDRTDTLGGPPADRELRMVESCHYSPKPKEEPMPPQTITDDSTLGRLHRSQVKVRAMMDQIAPLVPEDKQLSVIWSDLYEIDYDLRASYTEIASAVRDLTGNYPKRKEA